MSTGIQRAKILQMFRMKLETGKDVSDANNEILQEVSPGPPYNLTERQDINKIIASKEGVSIARGFVKPEAWEVHSLDVWGNEEEGYEINNEFRAGMIAIPYGATDEELLEILKEEHLQSGVTLKQVEFDEQSSEGFFAVIDKKTGEPIYHVYRRD